MRSSCSIRNSEPASLLGNTSRLDRSNHSHSGVRGEARPTSAAPPSLAFCKRVLRCRNCTRKKLLWLSKSVQLGPKVGPHGHVERADLHLNCTLAWTLRWARGLFPNAHQCQGSTWGRGRLCSSAAGTRGQGGSPADPSCDRVLEACQGF
ncbi:hypothetical protein BCV70DRAFT_1921 [Testicularia cyperi]|uniref:Uncharacterized protein n=1 Tax=Testicularia cyperi TaxID=1882483 RepID=A0A317XX91_9BASI|nr:hypothetical protein BCV70DRAFT_1921 [Testicularia cyperi]